MKQPVKIRKRKTQIKFVSAFFRKFEPPTIVSLLQFPTSMTHDHDTLKTTMKISKNNIIYNSFLSNCSGTSTRKPRLNSALAAQQAGTLPGASGVPNGTSNAKLPKSSRSKTKHKKYPARLTNVDRSTAQTCEVTLNSVTVVITEYKPKQLTASASRRESSEQSYSESNDSRSQRMLNGTSK